METGSKRSPKPEEPDPYTVSIPNGSTIPCA